MTKTKSEEALRKYVNKPDEDRHYAFGCLADWDDKEALQREAYRQACRDMLAFAKTEMWEDYAGSGDVVLVETLEDWVEGE